MFAKFLKTACLFALATSAAACTRQVGSPEDVGGSNQTIAFPQAEKNMVVTFVNDPATDLETLDDTVGLDVRAAKNILAHRAGRDGVYPSADDNLFDNLEELDAVPYVGNSALTKLRDYVVAHPATQAELVEGVDFSAEQADAVIWGVNQASVDELRNKAGLIRPAAENLVAGAPYGSVSEMGEVGEIGPAALTALRNHSPVWAAAKDKASTSQAGSYDGVEFDDQTASIALSIANTASYEQLTGEGGMYSGGANAIVGGRPFVTLGQVSDTYGVGAATMRTLHDYAASGQF